MPSPVAITQLARIIGEPVLDCLGVHAGDALPGVLSPEHEDAIQQLTRQHAEHIAEALIQEALIRDDVQDTPSALVYLEDRLRFFGSLLPDEARVVVRERYREALNTWGTGR